jgi:hypothetical protein
VFFRVGGVPQADVPLVSIVAAVTIYKSIALAFLFWWADRPSFAPLVFSLLVILFFVFEQAGVGRNMSDMFFSGHRFLGISASRYCPG